MKTELNKSVDFIYLCALNQRPDVTRGDCWCDVMVIQSIPLQHSKGNTVQEKHNIFCIKKTKLRLLKSHGIRSTLEYIFTQNKVRGFCLPGANLISCQYEEGKWLQRPKTLTVKKT